MAVDKVTLDGCWIDDDSVFKEQNPPDTMLNAAIGRRVGDLLGHHILAGHPVLDALITGTLDMERWQGVLFYADTSALVVKRDS